MESRLILTDDVYQAPRRLPYCELQLVDKHVSEWLELKIIPPSTYEYASPIVLVAKKSGQKRLCCDSHKLNGKIVRGNFPMVHMERAIEKLQGASIFTTLDLKNCNFHVPVEENSQKYFFFYTDRTIRVSLRSVLESLFRQRFLIALLC